MEMSSNKLLCIQIHRCDSWYITFLKWLTRGLFSISWFTYFVRTDVDAHSMVGNSTCLAASDFLVGFCVFVKGPYLLWGSFMFGWWGFHMDFAWVHIAPLSFPHGNKKLLVLSLSLTYITQMNGEFKNSDDVTTTCFRGNTLHYLLHGCHHKHPMDGLRLVFPPAATAILSVPVSSKND